MTVNTLLKNIEINELFDYLGPFYQCGLDGVIVQDFGVLQYIKTTFPNLPIHCSTQMNIHGVEGVRFLKSQGVERVILARELSLAEIKNISKQLSSNCDDDKTFYSLKGSIQLETFVHGALCYSYSGQCLLSSLIGGRSGNRGQCAGTCRLPYTVKGQKKYFLSPKDICSLKLIPEMIEGGISSFKIEGRMKKPEYVAIVTHMYRKYIDLYYQMGAKDYFVADDDITKLADIYNRGSFSSGYYNTHNSKEMLHLDNPGHMGVAAVRVITQEGRIVKGMAIENINKGDILELKGSKYDYTFGEGARKGKVIQLNVSQKLKLSKGDILYRIRNEYLINHIRENIINSKLKVEIQGSVKLNIGRPALLELTCMSNSVWVTTKETVEQAKNRPLTKNDVAKKILKTSNTYFEFSNLEVEIDSLAFIPIKSLNDLRRRGLEELRRVIILGFQRETNLIRNKNNNAIARANYTNKEYLAVSVETISQLKALESYKDISRIYLPDSLAKKCKREILKLKEKKIEVFLSMPYIFRQRAKEFYKENSLVMEELYDGYLMRNVESFYFIQEHLSGYINGHISRHIMKSDDFQDKHAMMVTDENGRAPKDHEIVLDHNLYVFNEFAKIFWQVVGNPRLTAPLELNKKELKDLGVEGMEILVYGHIPTMVSAQCLQKNSSHCQREKQDIVISDRRETEFVVKKYCDFCYNIVYNSVPLCLFGEIEEIYKLKTAGLRIAFTVENENEVRHVMDEYIGSTKRHKVEGITRGHFKRGV